MSYSSMKLPFSVVPPPARQPVAGWFTSAAGWSIALGTVSVWLILCGVAMEFFGEITGFVLLVALSPAVVAIFPWSIRLIAKGRQMRAERALELLARDPRPPVLFLRSFQDDDLIDPSFPATNQIVPVRYESRLVKSLKTLGPAVALGRPGEAQPELGAARLYVGDSDWQDAISYFIDRAVAVVAVVGRSQGLWWEIEFAANRVPPGRLLLFFPFPASPSVRGSFWRSAFLQNPFFGKWMRRKMFPAMEAERQERYRAFRERFSACFKFPLPASLGHSRFLHFDEEGRAQLLPPGKPPLLVRIFTLNFRPTLDVPFAREVLPFVNKLVRTRGERVRERYLGQVSTLDRR